MLLEVVYDELFCFFFPLINEKGIQTLADCKSGFEKATCIVL